MAAGRQSAGSAPAWATPLDHRRVLPLSVVDGCLAESPAQHVRRPKVDTESSTLGHDRMELGAFLVHAAAAGPLEHALACLLGLLGLRVAEACASTSSTWAPSAATGR
jgi:hypothetical protein